MILKDSLLFSDNRQVESAYVITLPGNSISEKLSERCVNSCINVGQPVKVWQAFDGTNKKDVLVPSFLENQEYLRWIKQPNDKYSTSQIATFFSHLSLWSHCATIDRTFYHMQSGRL